MTPLFFTLESNQSLRIMPETRVIMDGHPIISYNYKVFLDGKNVPRADLLREQQQAPDEITSPDYLGYITFEKPGHIFTYTSGNGPTLQSGEVEEVIEYISHLRDNPSLWRSMGQL